MNRDTALIKYIVVGKEDMVFDEEFGAYLVKVPIEYRQKLIQEGRKKAAEAVSEAINDFPDEIDDIDWVKIWSLELVALGEDNHE